MLSRSIVGWRAAVHTSRTHRFAASRREYAQVAPSGVGNQKVVDISHKLPTQQTSTGKVKEKLVILGSGWAGYTVLRNVDRDRYDVFLVSPNSYFTMTPLLASAATGSVDFNNVIEPIRNISAVHYYHAWCDAIDFQQKQLHLTPAYPPPFRAPDPLVPRNRDQQSTSIPDARGGHSSAVTSAPHRRPLEGSEESSESDTTRHHSHDLHETWKTQEEGRVYTMPYDKLVIACGTYQRTFGTPGVVQNAWFLKDVQNARAVRWRVLECFEQAEHPELNDEQRRKLLNFIVVGGGPTGAEMAAALYDLVNSDLKRTFPEIHHLAKITIVDAAGAILNTFDESLQKYARDNFLHDGIDLKLNRKPVRVDRGNFVVEPDGEIPFGMLIWSTGNTQGPLVASITEAAKDKSGSLQTNGHMQLLQAGEDGGPATSNPGSNGDDAPVLDGVYALGDCAQIVDYSLPATAQVASQKAEFLARILGSDPPEGDFRWHDRGSMTRLTSGKGIAQFRTGDLKGKSASALWHSTYGLYMTISWRNRIMICLNWLINRLGGRSLSRM